MALVDDPKAFVLRMFQMEINEGRGANCQVFPEGVSTALVDLAPGELVYAVYKNKYYFTEEAMYVSGPAGSQRIVWSEVASCSTTHGDGSKKSKISTIHGQNFVINMTDIVQGHSGRVSQLIHGMIDRWGNPGVVGAPLMTIEEFLSHPDAEAAFAPNLEVRRPLAELRKELSTLRALPHVSQVFLSRSGSDDEELAVQAIVIVSSADVEAFASFSRRMGADGVVEADQGTRRKIQNLSADHQVYEVLFD